jgi:hypothetical protein
MTILQSADNYDILQGFKDIPETDGLFYLIFDYKNQN